MSDAEINAALARGRTARSGEPRAVRCRYESAGVRVVFELANECVFACPPRLVERLESASEARLAEVEILGAGSGPHW